MTPQLKQLPVSSLITEHNIRKDYGDLKTLAGTFQDGNPDELPVVSPNGSGDTFIVIGGNRRVEAARQKGITHLYCIVREIDLDDLCLRQLIADLQHQALSAIERAQGMRRLMERGWSQKEVGHKLGISESEVSRTLALLDLNPEVQQAVAENRISKGIADILSPLDPEVQAEVLPDILKSSGGRSGKPTVNQARRIVSKVMMTEEEHQAKEDEAIARSLERIAEETRQKQMPDLFENLIDDGEPAEAVHFLYWLMEADYQVSECRKRLKLDGASPDLLKRIRTAAASLAEETAKILEVTE